MQAKLSGKCPSQRARRQRMVLVGELEDHSVRQTCMGAAEYAARQSDLDFEPWPFFVGSSTPPALSDFNDVDCLLLGERAHDLIFGNHHPLHKPHVFILANKPHPKGHLVRLDERAIGRMAAEHLLNRGYNHLAAVVPTPAEWARLRAEGFKQTCLEHSASFYSHALSTEILPVYWRSNFSKRNEQLRQILVNLPKPCGILAANDVIACFIIETARYYGIRVPQEIGVIGVDDDPIPNSAAGLAISSIQPPFRELGWQAARLLDQLRRGHKVPRQIILPPVRVVVRTSSDVFMVEDNFVRKAQAYIEEKRSRPLRIAELAKAMQTSQVTLGKHFRRHLNMSPSDYILQRRIEYARELLREGQMNVDEVSTTCGFHSCSYFCQIFKQVTSVSPGSVRRGATV